uniref:Uncharacterized protein n=1 Tax=viral metagenome TaxID=1070528 RepID=A0A6C0BMZ2_9ZZZZ
MLAPEKKQGYIDNRIVMIYLTVLNDLGVWENRSFLIRC